MTRSDALRDLLEKVEAGVDFVGHELNRAIDAIGQPYKDGVYATATYIRDAQRGSLDAAKALHEAVLVQFDAQINITTTPTVQIFEPFDDEWEEVSEGASSSPARAWLIAVLKALIATEDN